MSGGFHVLVSCEHGGNRVPARYRELFRRKQKLLDSHRGFDPGALATAKLLARRLGARLHASTVSRLVVELNRSPGHPRLFSDVMRELSLEERERVLSSHYFPHRERIEAEVTDAVRRGRHVLHIASHTFTPRFRGEVRSADVAWLYDPSRHRERRLCDSWRSSLASIRPELRLRFNYPYRGADDGLTTYLRRRFRTRYVGIELEVNQKWHAGDAAGTEDLLRDIVDALVPLIQRMGSKR